MYKVTEESDLALIDDIFQYLITIEAVILRIISSRLLLSTKTYYLCTLLIYKVNSKLYEDSYNRSW